MNGDAFTSKEGASSRVNSFICIHPNYELYGSDRSFANSVAALLDNFPLSEINVIFPRRGPILSIPPFNNMSVIFRPLWVLRRNDLVIQFTRKLFRNISALVQAIRDMNRHNVTYINTVIAFDFILGARFSKSPVLIHVREIPVGLEMIIIRALLVWSRGTLIFNSDATRRAFNIGKNIRSHVVYNGFADPGVFPPPSSVVERPMEILVIGRINHWKGQKSVVSAIAKLDDEHRRRVRCRIVGGVFERNTDSLEELQREIQDNNLQEIVTISTFTNDPASHYLAADLVVVPSVRPEPFGRVAIEAMAYARPVVGTAHGGLLEIIEDNKTGRLFSPGDAAALADIFRDYLSDPSLAGSHGAAGRDCFLRKFTTERTNEAFIEVFRSLVAEARR